MTDGPLSPQDEDWQRFCAVETMVNHWDRPDWWPGREAYYWYLTFDSPELRDMAAACQERLRLPYLDPVPLDGLHLTLPKVGWTDEVTEDEAHLVADEAARLTADFPPFELTVGPLAGSKGAVRFSVSPWEPVVELASRLRRASNAIAYMRADEGEFRPHIGIAYCNSPAPADSLRMLVRDLRSMQPAAVQIVSVNLVVLWRASCSYAWSILRSIPLQTAAE